MEIITADVLPNGYKLKEIFGMVESTFAIEVSAKSLGRRLMEGQRNEHQEAYDALITAAKQYQGANMVYGLRVSSAVGQFSNASYLYLTYCGTVAAVERE